MPAPSCKRAIPHRLHRAPATRSASTERELTLTHPVGKLNPRNRDSSVIERLVYFSTGLTYAEHNRFWRHIEVARMPREVVRNADVAAALPQHAFDDRAFYVAQSFVEFARRFCNVHCMLRSGSRCQNAHPNAGAGGQAPRSLIVFRSWLFAHICTAASVFATSRVVTMTTRIAFRSLRNGSDDTVALGSLTR